MTCEEAAEFVSALYDYETIPQAAAGHIGACASCQARIKEYIEIGMELRRVASLESLEEARPRAWEKRQAILSIWWQKGWETMRIPRLAFAMLLTLVVALSSGLTLIGVRAHERGTLVMLKVAPDDGNVTPCPLSTEDKNYSDCEFSVGMRSGFLSYKIRLLSKDGNRIQLGVRTAFVRRAFNVDNTRTSGQKLQGAVEQQYWFEPGKTLQVGVDGLGSVAVTGKWLDHVPYFAKMDVEDNLQPRPNELRMISPILLRSDHVVFDAAGGVATSSDPNAAFWVYVQGDGVYVLSLSPMPGAVQGQVADNRVSFELGGQSYQFVTGAPMTREGQVWILHAASTKSPFDGAIFGSGSTDGLLPLLQTKK